MAQKLSPVISPAPRREHPISFFQHHDESSYIAQPISQPRYYLEDLRRYERMLPEAEPADRHWIMKSINVLLGKLGRPARYMLPSPGRSPRGRKSHKVWYFLPAGELKLLSRKKRKGQMSTLEDYADTIAFLEEHPERWICTADMPAPPGRKRTNVLNMLVHLMAVRPKLRVWRRHKHQYANVYEYYVQFTAKEKNGEQV